MLQNLKRLARRPSVSIATWLPFVLVILVVSSIAPVIAVSVHVVSDAASEREIEQAAAVVDGLEQDVKGLLDPIFAQLVYIRQAVSEGKIDISDLEAVQRLTHSIVASSSQVMAVQVIDALDQTSDWATDGETFLSERPARSSTSSASIGDVPEGGQRWANTLPNLSLIDGRLQLDILLDDGDRNLGMVVVSVASERIPRAIDQAVARSGTIPFVLFGRDRPYAMPSIPGSSEVDGANVLAHLWRDTQPLRELSNLPGVQGHWGKVDGRPFIYVYREISGYGAQSLFAAVAIPTGHTPWYWWVAHVIALFALAMVVLAPVAAWWLGRVLNRPMVDLDEALRSIEHFDFDRVFLPNLRKGRVREWRRMGQRLESTAHALSRLQTYVPRVLVRRLLTNPERAGVPEWRNVAVMFLDMEGFTRFSRAHTAQEVATHLNEVFAIVGPIIETTGGVIDKYTGDGLLAFWEMPDDPSDHIGSAVEAARAIVEDLGAFLDHRGGDLPRARIGLHAGPAIVGNVGFAGRVDYTLVGDTINTAQRTEAALRGVRPDLSVVVAATECVFAVLHNRTDIVPEALVMKEPVEAWLCRWRRAPNVNLAMPSKIKVDAAVGAPNAIAKSAA